MGVPAFFGWLIRNFKNKILLKSMPNNITIEYYYEDANCLFHPECNKIKDYFKDETDVEKLEKKMFERILNYLSYLEYYVNPKKMLYLSVDGVAPLAKMVQQRKRRYKSIIDNEYRDIIKKKYKLKSNHIWNNTVITPGTEFMENLHQCIMRYFEKKKTNDKTYIYSSYHSVGEGEHKILQHIKKNTKENDVVVIYGLDADLIFLALASQKKNIYLLREALQLGIGTNKEDPDLYDPVKDVGQELMYVSIDEIKNTFNNIMWDKCSNVDYSNDFIFICFLLGNDFLPHFLSIDIYNGGLDFIIACYIECVKETNQLIISFDKDKVKINNVMFIAFLEKVALNESNYFKTNVNKKNNKKCHATDDYSKEIWELENLKNINIDDPIKLGYGDDYDWKFRYYEHYFYICEHQDEYIEVICRKYLEGIMWVTKYYFEECKNWQWQYPFDHSPFLIDIVKIIKKYNIDINEIKIEDKENIQMMVQLTSVLPPDCSKLLPKSYASLVQNAKSPIIDLFPKKTTLDMLYKSAFWQCTPKLPYLDVERIKNETNKKKLTKDENLRQKILMDFVY